jgi:DNA-binding NarL/FixJ family response regulator
MSEYAGHLKRMDHDSSKVSRRYGVHRERDELRLSIKTGRELAVILCLIEGKSFGEVARLIGCTEKTVHNLRRRVRERSTIPQSLA